MIRPAISSRRIAVSRHDNLGVPRSDPSDRLLKVINFKPEEHAVAVRFVIRVADRAVMMRDLKAVQLHHQFAVMLQTFVLRAAVRALTSKESLIPPAAGFH